MVKSGENAIKCDGKIGKNDTCLKMKDMFLFIIYFQKM